MVRVLDENRKKNIRTHVMVSQGFFLQNFRMGNQSAKDFPAGIRTQEGRVKADNDNHYITGNSCLPFGRPLFGRC